MVALQQGCPFRDLISECGIQALSFRFWYRGNLKATSNRQETLINLGSYPGYFLFSPWNPPPSTGFFCFGTFVIDGHPWGGEKKNRIYLCWNITGGGGWSVTSQSKGLVACATCKGRVPQSAFGHVFPAPPFQFSQPKSPRC